MNAKQSSKIYTWLVMLFALLMLVLTSSCKVTDLSTYDATWHTSIAKGNHYAMQGRKDGLFEMSTNQYEYQYCFKDVYYKYNDEDQKDWNKSAAGIVSGKLRPHNEVYINEGWNVNPEDSSINVNFYNHGIVKGNNEYFKIANGAWFTNTPEGYITIPYNGCYNVRRFISEDRLFGVTYLNNPYNNRTIVDSVQYKKPFPKTFFLTQAYHGGNRTAQNREKFIVFFNTQRGMEFGEEKKFLFIKWRKVK